MRLELLLALRFLRNPHQEKALSSMIKICFIGICIGTFALTLVAAIMNGFEKATHQKLQSIHADITIQSQGKPLNFEKLKQVLTQEFSADIEALSPSSTNQVVIQSQQKQHQTQNLVILKGIDPQAEPQVNALKTMLIGEAKTCSDWSSLLGEDGIFIGQTLAQQLGIKVGDTINLLYQPEELVTNKITLISQHARIAALFKTGISEFDEHVIFSSLEFFQELFQTGITHVSIKLKNPQEEKSFVQRLKKRLSLEVYSWKDLYPALVSALTLEKYAMIVILTLVTLVASMNMISLLFMYITQKRREIALLKSLSMSNRSLIVTFMLLGLTISLTASGSGILLASLASWLLQKYPFITLPDIYYVTHLPAQLEWPLVILVLVSTSFLTILAIAIPARSITTINIAHLLKNSEL